jgi:hypothetical protein
MKPKKSKMHIQNKPQKYVIYVDVLYLTVICLLFYVLLNCNVTVNSRREWNLYQST